MDNYDEIYKYIDTSVSENTLISKAKMIEFIEMIFYPFILGLLYFSIVAALPYHITTKIILTKLDSSSFLYIGISRFIVAWVSGNFAVVWKLVYDRTKQSIYNMSGFAWNILSVLTSNNFMKSRVKAHKKMILSNYIKHIQVVYEKYTPGEPKIVRRSLVRSGICTLIYLVLFLLSVF